MACKVIQHNRSTLAAVEAEADLMLALNHENLVKAYHYCTYAYAEQAFSEKSRKGSRGWSATARESWGEVSQSSGGSSNVVRRGTGTDSAQQLGRPFDLPPPASSNSGSGNSSVARVMLQRQRSALEQQQQSSQQLPQLLDSHDVLVTNLSLGPDGAQEATTIASSIVAASSVATKGSADTFPSAMHTNTKSSGGANSEDRGMFGAGESGTETKLKAETWLVSLLIELMQSLWVWIDAHRVVGNWVVSGKNGQ